MLPPDRGVPHNPRFTEPIGPNSVVNRTLSRLGILGCAGLGRSGPSQILHLAAQQLQGSLESVVVARTGWPGYSPHDWPVPHSLQESDKLPNFSINGMTLLAGPSQLDLTAQPPKLGSYAVRSNLILLAGPSQFGVFYPPPPWKSEHSLAG